MVIKTDLACPAYRSELGQTIVEKKARIKANSAGESTMEEKKSPAFKNARIKEANSK